MSVCRVLAALVSSSEADTFVPKARALVTPVSVHRALITSSGLGLLVFLSLGLQGPLCLLASTCHAAKFPRILRKSLLTSELVSHKCFFHFQLHYTQCTMH